MPKYLAVSEYETHEGYGCCELTSLRSVKATSYAVDIGAGVVDSLTGGSAAQALRANTIRPLSITDGFQSTPSYGGRLDGQAGLCTASCFNPRPRTEGDSAPSDEWLEVSIHALVRRATNSGFTASILTKFQSTPSYGGRHIEMLTELLTDVSIHALVRRATSGP